MIRFDHLPKSDMTSILNFDAICTTTIASKEERGWYPATNYCSVAVTAPASFGRSMFVILAQRPTALTSVLCFSLLLLGKCSDSTLFQAMAASS
jgi:hypothetical protein